MTSQELFDTCVERLIKQGKPAKNNFGICSYLTKCGLKCAVGILLKEGEYSPTMEGDNVENLVDNGMLPKRLAEHKLLLMYLQQTHDGTKWSPTNMEDFKRAADKFSLKWKFDNAKIQQILSS